MWNHIPFLVIIIIVGVMGLTRSKLIFAVPSLILYWMVGLNLESDYRECEWIGNADSSNPLYERGFIRKKETKITVLSNLKGFWFCRIISLVFIGVLVLYDFWRHLNNMRYCIWFERLVLSGLIGLFGIWLTFRIYYKWRYRQDFRYVESPEGIWKPFSYIFQYINRGMKQSHLYRYEVDYEEIRENLRAASLKKGYCFSLNYSLGDSDEINFFTRQKHDMLDILSLIFVEKLEPGSWEEFNLAFSEYWKTSINLSTTVKNADITFLICVKESSRELRKKTNLSYGVDQKKGRYRLPAILSYEDAQLIVSKNLYSRHGQKQYDHMRRELLEMLGISEHYNNK